MTMEKKKKKEEIPTAGKTENFFTRNVKPLTFLLCVVVLFGGFVFLDIYARNSNFAKENGKEMTVEEAIALSEYGEELTLSQLRKYRGELGRGKEANTYTIEFGNYLLRGMQPKDAETLTYCTITDLNDEEEVDVLKGDVKAFFDARPAN